MDKEWVSILAAVILIALNRKALQKVVQYYVRPGSLDLNFTALNSTESNIAQIVILNFGLSILIISVIPETGATFESELPKSLIDALGLFGLGAIVEEVAFRLIPWTATTTLRKWSKRAQWAEYLNVITALLISVVFGILHVTNYNNPDLWTYLRVLPQMVGGLLYWYMLDEGGINSSIVAHFIFNMIVWSLTVM